MGAEANDSRVAPCPRISVVIPHLNEPDNLRRCLDALYRPGAGAPSFEVIVADNGSVVPPFAVCATYPKTRLVLEPHPGPGPARNTAASLARGDVICFIDADCFVEPDYLTICAAFFDTHPGCDFVGGSVGIAPSQPPRLIPAEAYEAAFAYRTEMFVRRQGFAATANMAVRREVFRVVGHFAGIARHEDRVWGQRAVSMGFELDYLPAARVLTPGSLNFFELSERIERHVAHDFAELGPGWVASLKWFVRAGMVLVSPPLGIAEIIRCAQIDGPWLQLQVFAYLCRARAYRAWLMMAALASNKSGHLLARWNRS
jgi:glycosyltransferase involved in cell wall biosynthesis